LTEAGNRHTRIYVVLTSVLAFFSALGTGAAWYQGIVANENADIARSALELQRSPWLGIEPGDVAFDASPDPSPADGTFSVNFKIPLHNFGSTPALNVNVYYDRKAYKYGGKYHELTGELTGDRRKVT
jgi:hypothetical protein